MRHAAKFHEEPTPVELSDVCGALAIAAGLIVVIGLFMMALAGPGPKLSPSANFGTAELADL